MNTTVTVLILLSLWKIVTFLQILVLAENRNKPEWHIRRSKWSTDCQSLAPSRTFCQDQLQLKRSQFCAQFEGMFCRFGASFFVVCVSFHFSLEFLLCSMSCVLFFLLRFSIPLSCFPSSLLLLDSPCPLLLEMLKNLAWIFNLSS